MAAPQTSGTDWFAWFLGIGFFATVWLSMLHGIPDGSSHDVVLMLVTAVVTYTGTMISFRYGSTASGEKKTDTIATMAQTATVATTTAAAVQAASGVNGVPVTVKIEPTPGEPIPVVVTEEPKP